MPTLKGVIMTITYRGFELDISYDPGEEETWGRAGGTPGSSADFEIKEVRDSSSGDILNWEIEELLYSEHKKEIWDKLNEELRNISL